MLKSSGARPILARTAWVLLISIAMVAQGCKTGYNRAKRPSTSGQKPPECVTTPSNTNLLDAGENIFRLLADLTCFKATKNGNLIGQTLGPGTLAYEDESDSSYEALITQLKSDTQHTPVVIEVEYAEFVAETNDQQDDEESSLSQLHSVLETHWTAGGLISLSWKPSNPLSSTDTTDYTNDIDLATMIEVGGDGYEEWRAKLKEVADALKILQDKGIIVLWRPLPEFNDSQYWWGLEANYDALQPSNAELYTNLWQDMYTVLTDDYELNNLLWVYSPLDSDSTLASEARTAVWGYPGNDIVDVVAPVVRTNTLQIAEYSNLLALKRPLAVAQWGPSAELVGSNSANFDATAYSDRLERSYSFVSYWLTSYSSGEDEQKAHRALIDLNNISDLFKRSHIIALEDAKEEALLSTRTITTANAEESESQ